MKPHVTVASLATVSCCRVEPWSMSTSLPPQYLIQGGQKFHTRQEVTQRVRGDRRIPWSPRPPGAVYPPVGSLFGNTYLSPRQGVEQQGIGNVFHAHVSEQGKRSSSKTSSWARLCQSFSRPATSRRLSPLLLDKRNHPSLHHLDFRLWIHMEPQPGLASFTHRRAW